MVQTDFHYACTMQETVFYQCVILRQPQCLPLIMELAFNILSTGKPSEGMLFQWLIPLTLSKAFVGASWLWRKFAPVGAFKERRQGATAARVQLVNMSPNPWPEMTVFGGQCPDLVSGYLLGCGWLSEMHLTNCRMPRTSWREQRYPLHSSWISHIVSMMVLPLNYGLHSVK